MQWLVDLVFDKVMLNFSGLIVAYTGAINTIPDGWLLCDGTNGTPDLRERFIRGAPDLTQPGTTGGDDTHLHCVCDVSCASSGLFPSNYFVGGPVLGGSHCHFININSGCADSRPAFYEVLYIMHE